MFATFLPPSQLLVYNSADWSGGEGDLAAYHVPADTDTAEARVALMEKTVEVSRYFLWVLNILLRLLLSFAGGVSLPGDELQRAANLATGAATPVHRGILRQLSRDGQTQGSLQVRIQIFLMCSQIFL